MVSVVGWWVFWIGLALAVTVWLCWLFFLSDFVFCLLHSVWFGCCLILLGFWSFGFVGGFWGLFGFGGGFLGLIFKGLLFCM